MRRKFTGGCISAFCMLLAWYGYAFCGGAGPEGPAPPLPPEGATAVLEPRTIVGKFFAVRNPDTNYNFSEPGKFFLVLVYFEHLNFWIPYSFYAKAEWIDNDAPTDKREARRLCSYKDFQLKENFKDDPKKLKIWNWLHLSDQYNPVLKEVKIYPHVSGDPLGNWDCGNVKDHEGLVGEFTLEMQPPTQ
jgi:hypothetical protein